MWTSGLTFRAQERGTGGIRQPATSRQAESAIPRCLQRFVRVHYHIIHKHQSSCNGLYACSHSPLLLRKSSRLATTGLGLLVFHVTAIRWPELAKPEPATIKR